MDDQEFHRQADRALEDLFQRLANASGTAGFEADFNGGALVIEFDDHPAKFVVSPNAPVKQIWLSANLKSFKLGWDERRGIFASDDGASLAEVVAANITEQTGAKVSL